MSNYTYSTNTDRDHYGSQTPTGSAVHFLSQGTPVEARWASGDSRGNPKIVANNEPPIVHNSGSSLPLMQPLNLDIDPSTWELKSPDLHRLLGCEY